MNLVNDVVENEQVYPFDVDQTLVSERRSEPLEGDLGILNPYTGDMVYVKPHVGHVDLLKEMHGRGRYIIMWSAAGAQWAKAVRDALGLKPFVSLTMTKPLGYIDDKPVETWLTNWIFLEPEERT